MKKLNYLTGKFENAVYRLGQLLLHDIVVIGVGLGGVGRGVCGIGVADVRRGCGLPVG